jgi:2'-5' RNA ligase
MSSALPPFVLTLKLDQLSFAYLDDLRRQHFPPARNIVPAHITLFHALPGDQESAIRRTLHDICVQTHPFELTLPTLRFLGRGVALEVASPGLTQLRQELATVWGAWLSAQDQQRYRPHITIQNKTAPHEARQLYDQLVSAWTPRTAQGEGLLLWRYIGGPWELAAEFAFEARV